MVQLTLSADPVTGKARRVRRRAKTKTDANRILRQLIAEREQGRPLTADRRITVGAWLEQWITEVVPATVSTKTLDGYESMVRVHLKPALGHLKLAELEVGHVDSLLAAKAKAGASANTRRIMRTVLGRAIKDAMRRNLVQRNVVQLSAPPKKRRSEKRALTPEQRAVLFDTVASRPDPLRGVLELLWATGARVGEICGLQWGDNDETSVRLRRDVERVPVAREAAWGQRTELRAGELKNESSRRTLPLTPAIAAVLARVRPAEPTADGWVFVGPKGGPVDPKAVGARFRELTTEVLGESWTVHELRHSAITHMLASGAPIEVVSQLVGHSSITMTADIYHHPTLDAFSQALAMLDDDG